MSWKLITASFHPCCSILTIQKSVSDTSTSPSFMRGYKDNSPIVSTAKKVVYCLNPAKTQAIERLSKQKEKGFRETAKYGNLSKSLYFWAFQNFFTCFVTEELRSQHATRQWLECLQYTGINLLLMYGGTYQPSQAVWKKSWNNSPILFWRGGWRFLLRNQVQMQWFS